MVMLRLYTIDRRIVLLLIILVVLLLAAASCSDEAEWERLAPAVLGAL